MSPLFLAGASLMGAALGLLATLLNGTHPLTGLTGGLVVGQLAALLAPRDEDDGGVAEEEEEPVTESMFQRLSPPARRTDNPLPPGSLAKPCSPPKLRI